LIDSEKVVKPDGTVKSAKIKARESFGMRRTYEYAAMTKDEAKRRPARHLAGGDWTLYEAVNVESTYRHKGYDVKAKIFELALCFILWPNLKEFLIITMVKEVTKKHVFHLQIRADLTCRR
jgi:hypothetical protein